MRLAREICGARALPSSFVRARVDSFSRARLYSHIGHAHAGRIRYCRGAARASSTSVLSLSAWGCE